MRKLIAVLVLLVACSRQQNPNGQSPKGTMQDLAAKTTTAYSIVTPPDPELLPGRNRLVFAVLDKQQAFVPNLDLVLFFARKTTDSPKGPLKVSFQDDGLGDRSFYKAEIDFPSTGQWLILLRDSPSQGAAKGAGTQLKVVESTKVPRIGEKAISVPSPTALDHQGLEDICTREPDDPMHELSLDAALGNGKVTVVTFATPAFCASRVCGPVVDQVLRVRNENPDRANFIHIEVFKNHNTQEFTEPMKAWRLSTEPWTFVIDSNGIIKGRFEGPVTTGEIKEALKGAE